MQDKRSLYVKSRDPRARLGALGERIAISLLRSEGYVIEQTNVRFPVGEIDIVAREGQTLCFVEVRSASSMQWGGALSSIGERKRNHIIQAARWYLGSCNILPEETRFDVVAIHWDDAKHPTAQLIRGAFDAGRSSAFLL